MNYISIQSSQDVIKHYGTKGMKWGLRKTLKTFGRMAGNALRHPNLSNYAYVKEQSLHRNDRDIYDFKKSISNGILQIIQKSYVRNLNN